MPFADMNMLSDGELASILANFGPTIYFIGFPGDPVTNNRRNELYFSPI